MGGGREGEGLVYIVTSTSGLFPLSTGQPTQKAMYRQEKLCATSLIRRLGYGVMHRATHSGGGSGGDWIT